MGENAAKGNENLNAVWEYLGARHRSKDLLRTVRSGLTKVWEMWKHNGNQKLVA